METRKEIEESNLLFSFDDSYDVIKLQFRRSCLRCY